MIQLDYKTVLALAAVGAVSVYVVQRNAKKAVETVGEGVDPFNHDNWFNQFAEYGYGKLTGSQGTPGTDFYDWVHSQDRWWN